jgi:intracellular septation protein
MKKLFVDLFPLIVFFTVFKLIDDPREGILMATGAAIVATSLQALYAYWRHRRVEPMLLVTLALIVVLGGATLFFDDERFIKWKPTAVNWLFGLAFIGSELWGAKNLVRRMLEGKLSLPAAAWTRLNLVWAAFFLSMGAANLFVAYRYPTEIWVNFKVFGLLGLTLLFVVAQAIYLARYMDAEVDSIKQ